MINAKTFIRAVLEYGNWKCAAGENHYLDYSHEYATGQGYDLRDGGNGILFANWNDSDCYDRTTKTRVKVCNCMPRLAEIAEHAGYAIEWADEWSTCSGCGKALRTAPDCYSWTPSYYMGEGEILCLECVNPHDVIRELNGDHNCAVPSFVKLEENGYVPARSAEYESGLYGTNDKPAMVALKLENAGVKRFVFQVANVEQFRVEFMVFVRRRDVKRARMALAS